jgi:pyrroloquinoline quinone (PQQ) biosynthesis protein C
MPQKRSSTEFLRRPKEKVTRSSKLRVNHPFLRAVCKEKATMEQIRRWALQDYQFRSAVPRIAMLRYLACTDPEIAVRLREVVEKETRGLLLGSAGHADMFAESIGITKHELVIHTLPWFIMMAAQVDADGAFSPVAALGQGFIKQYTMSPESVRFFTIHVEANEAHGTLAEDILLRYITSPHLQQQTHAAMLRRMALLYDVWSIDY